LLRGDPVDQDDDRLGDVELADPGGVADRLLQVGPDQPGHLLGEALGQQLGPGRVGLVEQRDGPVLAGQGPGPATRAAWRDWRGWWGWRGRCGRRAAAGH